MKKVNYDFLEKCTKQELITKIKELAWIRQMFRYSDILFTRWQIKSKKLQEKRRLNCDFFQELDGKKQDELAHQFNKESDINKKLEIADKMKSYDSNLRCWFKKEKQLQREEKKLNALFDSIDIQRQKES